METVRQAQHREANPLPVGVRLDAPVLRSLRGLASRGCSLRGLAPWGSAGVASADEAPVLVAHRGGVPAPRAEGRLLAAPVLGPGSHLLRVPRRRVQMLAESGWRPQQPFCPGGVGPEPTLVRPRLPPPLRRLPARSLRCARVAALLKPSGTFQGRLRCPCAPTRRRRRGLSTFPLTSPRRLGLRRRLALRTRIPRSPRQLPFHVLQRGSEMRMRRRLAAGCKALLRPTRTLTQAPAVQLRRHWLRTWGRSMR